ncbi:poly-gamma-glutamate biosynthesis protein [Sporanaerobium hydrogeniformans]|uniref:Poly-gamma-glutamate biosynthesis protein n=2 Tax=Sporanaerobium hydrogeniformans TaxID=3072179 RepID=A0AC61DEZ7_9FIRM|nr:poly-gamma-glutamate biosynthesis protein [Sporanaerobium hydrogeniformans]
MLGIYLVGCGRYVKQDTEVVNTRLEQGSSKEEQVDETKVEIENTVGQSIQDIEKDKEIVITEEQVSIIMVGDVLLHTPVTESGKGENDVYNYAHLFKEVKEDIQEADLAIVNQEVILGGKELGLSGYPTFNGPYEVGDALVEAGFNVVLHATNHTLDKGKKGILNTLNFWETHYPQVGVLGIQDTQKEQEDAIYVYEKEGIKIAILNYTYGTNGIPLPDGQPYWVNLLGEDRLKKDINKAKALADFVIVCPHWGTEYTHVATKEQRYWAEFMAHEGVDLILGTHPHVIEPIEWIEGKNGHKTLVYYSLGNFVNSTSESGKGVAARMLGAMAKITLERDEKGQVGIKEYGAQALVTHLQKGRGNITTYRLQDYTEALAQINEIRKQDEAFSLSYCKEIWQQVFKEILEKTDF